MKNNTFSTNDPLKICLIITFIYCFIFQLAQAETLTCRLPKGKITVLSDVISEIETDCSCNVVSTKGSKIGERAIPSKVFAKKIPAREKFYPFGRFTMNSLAEGSNRLQFSINCDDGRSAQFESVVEVQRSIFRIAEAQSPSTPPDSPQTVTSSSSSGTTPSSTNPVTSQTNPNACIVKVGPVIIPYFGGANYSGNSFEPAEKARIWKENIAPLIQEIYHHQVPDGSIFDIDLVFAKLEMKMPMPGVGMQWNSKGFAPIYDGENQGTVLGIAAPENGALEEFKATLTTIHQQNPSSVPLILVDYLIDPETGKPAPLTKVLGYYNSTHHVILVGLRDDFISLPYIVENPGGTVEANLPIIIAHEMGHMFGLGHTANDLVANMMNTELWNPPSFELNATQQCFIRHQCFNPKVFGPPTYGIGNPGDEGDCFNKRLAAGPVESVGETCEIPFTGTTNDAIGHPFEANCKLLNPTPNGKPFNFSTSIDPSKDHMWGTLTTPYFCFKTVPNKPDQPSTEQQCRQIEFCGDGIGGAPDAVSKTGEECDPAAPVDSAANSCPSGKGCGGNVTDPVSGKATFRHCICVKYCAPDKKLFGPPCNLCCPGDATGCSNNACECPSGKVYNSATNTCDPAEEPKVSEKANR